MSTKRQPSKQRRQTQNQKQRAALAARREAAASSGQAPAGKVGGSARSAGGSRGSVLSRLRGAPATGRAVRTARSGSTGTTTGLPVGHRAAMSAVFAAIAAAVVGLFLIPVRVDGSGDVIVTREALVAEWSLAALDAAQEAPEGASAVEVADSIDEWTPNGEDPYAVAAWPFSASAVLPVVGTALGFRAIRRRSSARIVNRTMYVTLFGSLLAGSLLLYFLPAVIMLAVAAFQVRKVEVSEAAAAAGSSDDDVIEVAEVDDTDEADEVDEVDDAAQDLEDDGDGAADEDEDEPST